MSQKGEPRATLSLSLRPHLQRTATARQIADWAVQSDEGSDQLLEAIKEGPEALLKLAIKVSRLGSNEVRKLHKAKVEVLEPLSRLIRGEIGFVAAEQEEDFLHDLDDDQGIGPVCKDI
ncbi:MAG: hypothetical protein M1830_005229 [Pleopsidium flavum]|nr:MAG: hypothetical protein M1830_005229 [Pleopsidium flavum]